MANVAVPQGASSLASRAMAVVGRFVNVEQLAPPKGKADGVCMARGMTMVDQVGAKGAQ